MTADVLRRSVRVVNPAGLHLRPAAAVARAAQGFAASVAVVSGERRADCKSMTALLMLAVMPGTELVVEAEGGGATEALEMVCALLADPGES